MKPAFSVKSAHLDALSIQLNSTQIDEIRVCLLDQMDKYLKFKALPFILDAQAIENQNDLPIMDILALFALHELKIVGLRHANSEWERYAQQHQLVFISAAEKNPPASETSATNPTENQTANQTEVSETVVNNSQSTEPQPTESSPESNPTEDGADAFARALFGDTGDNKTQPENKESLDFPSSSDDNNHSDESDTLFNDNDAIKTVEMAKPAELVELSREEAQILAETTNPPPSELTSEDGEAKGEVVSISEAKQTIVVSTPVRTGQQIYAEKADLIVLGIVSPGAEVIADGNIHIYAPLRGRALAGASGDRKARIFVQSMQAELVSIAGIYRTFEQKLPTHLAKQAVRIELQDDRLAISSIIAE